MVEKFRVVYSGNLPSGANKSEVIQKFASAFKISTEKAEIFICSKKRRVIKSDLNRENATKYLKKLTEIGLQVRIVAIPPDALVSQASTPYSSRKVGNTIPAPIQAKMHTATYTKNKEYHAENPYASPASDIRKSKGSLVFPASRWRRFFNWVIDDIAYTFLSFIIGVIIGLTLEEKSNGLFSTIWGGYLFGSVIFFSYYILLEWSTGRTLGKLITGTKVVDENGEKPSAGQIAGRTLTRFVPFEAFSFFGAENRGWHDRWAKTYVVGTR